MQALKPWSARPVSQSNGRLSLGRRRLVIHDIKAHHARLRPWEHRPASSLNPAKWDGVEHLSVRRIGLKIHLVPGDSAVIVYEFTTGSTTQTIYLDEFLGF